MHWPNGQTINGTDSTLLAASACLFNNNRFVFWGANDSSRSIFYSASGLGAASWPAGKTINSTDSTPEPAASCVFGNKLYVFWKANDSSNSIYYSASTDGATWPSGQTINSVDSTPSALAACVFGGKLFLFWQANDSSNSIYCSASTDGATWPSGQTINSVDSTPAAPAACVFGGKLFLFWQANDSSNSIYYSASTDGATWPNGKTINPVDSTPAAPAACVFDGELVLFWQANDSSNSIFYSPPAVPSGMNLGLYVQHQEQTQWCWSAVTVSISLFYLSSSGWTQCSLVNQAFGRSDCCQNGGSGSCNQPWYPDRALTITGNLAQTTYQSLSLANLMSQIDAGRPVSIGIYWYGGGGHNPAIDGYDNSNPANPTIDIQDPWYGQSTQDFNSFPASYNGGATWGLSCTTHPVGGTA